MYLTSIQEALHKQPFRPFCLTLADGRMFRVPHPDFVAILGPSVIVADVKLDGSYSEVDPLLVTSLDFDKTPEEQVQSTDG